MDIYPAIDIRNGRVVRLSQGDESSATIYAVDPVEQAQLFVEAGARWLHVIDLDRAYGDGDNDEAIGRLVQRFGSRVQIQLGGGIRSHAAAMAALATGVRRVVLGTVAVTDPAMVEATVASVGPERVAVGIDVRDGMVAVRGWRETSLERAEQVAARVLAQGIRTIVYTDIGRDGMLVGLDLQSALPIRETGADLVLSGGLRSLADIKAAAEAKFSGVVVGRALYERCFTLSEALAAAG